MVEESSEEGQSTRPKIHVTDPGFPPAHLPTVYADGIVNLAPSPSVVRFYLFRSDPEQAGKAEYKNQIFAQVVMPVAGFVQMATFFEEALRRFVAQGVIPQQMVDAATQAERAGGNGE
jgi:hypothetical protein